MSQFKPIRPTPENSTRAEELAVGLRIAHALEFIAGELGVIAERLAGVAQAPADVQIEEDLSGEQLCEIIRRGR